MEPDQSSTLATADKHNVLKVYTNILKEIHHDLSEETISRCVAHEIIRYKNLPQAQAEDNLDGLSSKDSNFFLYYIPMSPALKRLKSEMDLLKNSVAEHYTKPVAINPFRKSRT